MTDHHHQNDHSDLNNHSHPNDQRAGDGGDGQALLADFPSNGSGMLPR